MKSDRGMGALNSGWLARLVCEYDGYLVKVERLWQGVGEAENLELRAVI